MRVTLERAGFRVVAECDDGNAAIAAASRLRPELCLLDVHMPFGGVRAAREIHRRLPGTRIVMLTVSSEIDDLVAALEAGACGYLLKDIDPERLPLALLGVLHGEAALPRTLVFRLIEVFHGRDDGAEDGHAPRRLTCLTARQSDVLELLAEGYSTSQIAARLSVAEVTVRSHISTIVRKLEVRDRDGGNPEAARASIMTYSPLTSSTGSCSSPRRLVVAAGSRGRVAVDRVNRERRLDGPFSVVRKSPAS